MLIWISAGTTTKLWTAPLQATQVRLYPLNVHANMPYGFIATFTRPDTTYEYETEVNRQLRQNMREAAQETGGELCGGSMSPPSCVQKALEDASDHYLLSYESHSRSSQPEWRQIRVKVSRPDVTVSARSGVLIAPILRTEEEKHEQIAAPWRLQWTCRACGLNYSPSHAISPDRSSLCRYLCSRTRNTKGYGIRVGWILRLYELCSMDPMWCSALARTFMVHSPERQSLTSMLPGLPGPIELLTGTTPQLCAWWSAIMRPVASAA